MAHDHPSRPGIVGKGSEITGRSHNLKIRLAKSSDREEILGFCVNTFSWGDYIDRVWDHWFHTGRLLVAEEDDRKIAMSHVTLCADGKSIWLEGVRVHPDYRRSRVATRLMKKMIGYGRKKGARQASAIVDMTNVASQRMVEKNGFEVASRWAYYSIGGGSVRKKSAARLAATDDLPEIWRYLQGSDTYHLSAKRYVKSWHWYALDRNVLRNFVREKSVMVSGEPIDGIALINMRGYWDRDNTMQIVYLDSRSKRSLQRLISLATNIYIDGGFHELQIVCHESIMLTSFFKRSMIKDKEQFLLYSRPV